MLATICRYRRPAPSGQRITVFEEDGMQPVSRICREAVRRAAAALAESGIADRRRRPAPRRPELRAAFDAIIAPRSAAAFASLAGREAELMP